VNRAILIFDDRARLSGLRPFARTLLRAFGKTAAQQCEVISECGNLLAFDLVIDGRVKIPVAQGAVVRAEAPGFRSRIGIFESGKLVFIKIVAFGNLPFDSQSLSRLFCYRIALIYRDCFAVSDL